MIGHITDKEENWEELCVDLLPGAHLLMISNPYDYHKNATAIEKAGFEIRDMLSYFCKDCFYLIVMARKPFDLKLSEKTGKPTKSTITAVENVIKHGVGAINIDACRVATDGNDPLANRKNDTSRGDPINSVGHSAGKAYSSHTEGRWPANVIHDGSEEILNSFPETGAAVANNRGSREQAGPSGTFGGLKHSDGLRGHNDNGGSAARYFYTASTKENLITYLQTMIGLTE
jgi:hypothetical protein